MRKKKCDTPPNFRTKDVWLAASLSLELSITPTLENEDGVILFCFQSNGNLTTAITNFYGGSALSCVGYSERVKTLRNKMFATKKELGLYPK